jgi:tetratricopeptide (TPR) repeat protein
LVLLAEELCLELAQKYFQATLPYFEKMQDSIGLGFYSRGLGDLPLARGQVKAAMEKYQQALVYHEQQQRGHREWGLALVMSGRLGEARWHLKESLAKAMRWISPDLKALPLLRIAVWLDASNEKAKTVEIAACVASKPTTWNEVKEQAGKLLAQAAQGISDEGARLREKRGEELTIDKACQRYGRKPGF